MRLAILSITSIALVLTATQAMAMDKRFDIESAIVEYNISGHIKGEETAYIQDWGAKEARFSKYFLMMKGFDHKQERMTLREGDTVYNVDLLRHKMVRVDLTKRMVSGLNINFTPAEMSDYSPEGLKRLGANLKGEESIAGKVCQVYELPYLEAKVWVYKNIAMKYIARTRGFRTEYTATSIQENVSIPQEKVTLPTKVIDMGLMEDNHLLGSIQPNSEYKPLIETDQPQK